MAMDKTEADLVSEANRWLDAQVLALKRRPFAELAKFPKDGRLDAPRHLSAFRFTVSRRKAEAEDGVVINVRRVGRRGFGGWEFREFEKYPNESFDLASIPAPHPVTEIARGLGRFECHLSPAEVGLHVKPSQMSLTQFNSLGFQRALDFRVFASFYDHEPKDLSARELGQLGEGREGRWQVGAPRPDTEALWNKLLDTAMPLVLQAPNNHSWVSRCIGKLYRPIVTINSGLVPAELTFIRRMIASHDDILLLSVEHYRNDVTFCGRGPIFEAALAAATARRFWRSHLTDWQRKEYEKLGLSVLPRTGRKMVRAKRTD